MKLLKNLLSIGVFMISLFSFTFSQDVTLSLDGGNLDYSSTADIAGFQFSHDGCVTGASGGDATANGFTVSASGTTVLAFSFTGLLFQQVKEHWLSFLVMYLKIVYQISSFLILDGLL